MFFALKGPNFDGNKHAQAALEKGALAAIVDDAEIATSDKFILVEDGLLALQELANHHRRQFKIPVIALTGSNGKTTTKELIALVLQKKYNTLKTMGNLNNHIGVPLTLLNLNKETEMAVIEMGANHLVEINQLCKIAEPNHGLITNIGKAHLEGFGSIKGVQQGKGELFEFLEAVGGKAFVNVNDPLIVEIAYYLQNAFSYGSQKFTDLHAEILEANPYLKLRWHFHKKMKREDAHIDVPTQLIGSYNLDNVLAAIAVGVRFKVSAENIVSAIADYVPANNRSEVLERNGNRYILDAYNANPTSMMAALKNLEGMTAKNKVAILGDMKEQGEFEKEEHQNIIEYSARFDQVYFVGDVFSILVKDENKAFQNVEDLKAHLQKQPIENATVLVKGSRSVQLEKLLS